VLAERYNEEASNSSMCDVCFNVLDEKGKKEQLLAHKEVLRTFSPVFKQQLQGQLDQLTTDDILQVDVKDFSSNSFKCFLNVVYGESLEMECGENFVRLFDLLKLADKYQNRVLFNTVHDYMSSLTITSDRGLDILAKVFEHKDFASMDALCGSLKWKCKCALLEGLKSATDVGELWAKKADNPELFDYLITSDMFSAELAGIVDKSMSCKQDVYKFLKAYPSELNKILLPYLGDVATNSKAYSHTFPTSQKIRTYPSELMIIQALSTERYHGSRQVCDVCFNVVDENGVTRQLFAHKLVLRAFSPVFRQQFHGPLKASTNAGIVQVDVNEFSLWRA